MIATLKLQKSSFYLLFLLNLLPLVAQTTIPLNSIIRDDSQFYWNSAQQIALITKPNKTVNIHVAQQFFLLNQQLCQGQFVLEQGELYLSQNTALMIENFLYDSEENSELLRDLVPLENDKHRITTILLDPGHGGKDSGAIGRHENFTIQEKDVTLKTSLALEKMLKERYPDKKILITRRVDEFISLEERVKMANNQVLDENEAMIFISIHANAAFDKSANGFEIWRLPDSTKRTLVADKTFDDNTQGVVNMFLNFEYLEESHILAQYILSSFKKTFGSSLTSRGERAENWFVVKNARMASILIELGFVSNEKEATLLNDDKHLQLMAKTIYNGIEDFIKYFEQ